MRTQTKPQLMLAPKEPAQEGTIGMFFDYYHKKGLLNLPKGIVINANKFKGNEQESYDRD